MTAIYLCIIGNLLFHLSDILDEFDDRNLKPFTSNAFIAGSFTRKARY